MGKMMLNILSRLIGPLVVRLETERDSAGTVTRLKIIPRFRFVECAMKEAGIPFEVRR